jgi:hypothetical protein
MQNATRLPTNRPPPRRKACGQCFRSKRRCGQEIPTCSRCERLKVDCEYLLQQLQKEPLPDCPSSGLTNNDTTPPALGISPPHQPILEDNALVRILDDEFLNGQWDQETCAQSLEMQELPDLWLSPQPSSFIPTIQDHVSQDLSHEAASRLHYGIGAFKRAISQMLLENSTPWSHPLLYTYFMPKSMSGRLFSSSISLKSIRRLDY